jgi:hypothetical protein
MSAADGDEVVEIERRSTSPDADEMMNLQLSVTLALAGELAAVAVSRPCQLPDLLPAVRSDDLPMRISDVPGLLPRLLAAWAAGVPVSDTRRDLVDVSPRADLAA